VTPPPPAPLRLVNRHTGEVLELIRVQHKDGLVLQLRGTLPPRQEGPPRHVHYREDEHGRVTAGTLSVERDGQCLEAAVGESVVLPRGVPHRWWNQGDRLLAFEGHVAPVVDLDRYLQAVFEVLNAGPPGRPSLIYLAQVSLRHRQTQAVLLLPAFLQPVVFRLAFLVGVILGRYRGTDWPGCPARCTGAPTMTEA
jgi:mannose-6-phosphate isomerase-like protein (cupin superfamily)